MDEPTIIEKLEKEPTEVVETPVEEKKGKNGLGLLVIVILLVIVFPLAVLGYLLVIGSVTFKGTNWFGTEDVEEVFVEEEEVTWGDWEGDYLKARLPEGWSVEELERSSDDHNMIGLDIVEIKNNDGKVLFSLNYNSGVGGILPCTATFIKFPDYSPEQYDWFDDYIKVGYLEEYGSDVDCPDEPIVQEVLIHDYVDIYFLQNHLRRVGGSVYADSVEGEDFFEVALGVPNEVTLDIMMILNGEYVLTTPFLISGSDLNKNNSDLTLLDQVLESMEIIDSTTVGGRDGSPEDVVSEEFTGEYIGVTSEVLDGSEYYQFQNVDMVNSQSTVYLVNKDSVSSLNLDLVEGRTYTIMGEKSELEGGAAAGTTYVEVVDVVSILDLETYVNETYNYKLEYPTDWTLTYTEGECPSASANLVGCENPDAYEYILTINKSDYYFEIVKLKEDNANNSAFVVYPDSEFEENYQDCVGWLTFDDYIDLSTGLEGSFRRNETWYEDVYPGVGGFYIAYRSNELEDDTNLYLLKNDFGSIRYQTPENVERDILLEMDTILGSISLME